MSVHVVLQLLHAFPAIQTGAASAPHTDNCCSVCHSAVSDTCYFCASALDWPLMKACYYSTRRVAAIAKLFIFVHQRTANAKRNMSSSSGWSEMVVGHICITIKWKVHTKYYEIYILLPFFMVFSDLCGPAILQLVLQYSIKVGVSFFFCSLRITVLIWEDFLTLSYCTQLSSSIISISKTCALVLNE